MKFVVELRCLLFANICFVVNLSRINFICFMDRAFGLMILWVNDYGFYRTPTKLREANVFSRVCLAFCSKGDGPCVGSQAQSPVKSPGPGSPRTGPTPKPCSNLFNLDLTVQGRPWTCSNLFNLDLTGQ